MSSSGDYFNFCVYLCVAAALLVVAVKRIYPKLPAAAVAAASAPSPLPLLASAVGAVAVTWYCILTFFFAAPRDRDRFVLAYQQVSEDPFGWVWSSMLLSWALTAACAAPSFAPQASWWELLVFFGLGEMVAISGAFPLLFVFAGRPAPARAQPAGYGIHEVAIVGHAAIFVGRWASEEAFDGYEFRIALALLHLFILLPAVLPRGSAYGMPQHVVLRMLAFASAMQHAVALAGAYRAAAAAAASGGLLALPSLLAAGLFRNRCQLSIGCDGIFAHLQSQYFLGRTLAQMAADVPLALAVSPGAVFAWRLAEQQEDDAEKKDR